MPVTKAEIKKNYGNGIYYQFASASNITDFACSSSEICQEILAMLCLDIIYGRKFLHFILQFKQSHSFFSDFVTANSYLVVYQSVLLKCF